ncbi:MAG: isoprenylcysteine carboxylmethyltransferase family protein [Hyphomonadaceae bacterium]
MTPGAAIVAAWLIWLGSWIFAAGWSARRAAQDDLGAESPSRVLTLAAIVMMIASYWPVPSALLWSAPAMLGWAMLAFVLAGLSFTWAARLHLGPLWSSASAPTDSHRIVETGPYALVRHPVYAGLLLAALATAIERGRIEAVAGVLTLIAGVALRAKLEERFLRRDLGDEAYAAYRSRVPMLIPFAK